MIQQNNMQSDFKWSYGPEDAKSYPVANGNTVHLFSRDKQEFYIKTVDANGYPLPLRVFEYREVTPQVETPAIAPAEIDYNKIAEMIDKSVNDALDKRNQNRRKRHKEEAANE